MVRFGKSPESNGLAPFTTQINICFRKNKQFYFIFHIGHPYFKIINTEEIQT
jgi:hypothetical protein